MVQEKGRYIPRASDSSLGHMSWHPESHPTRQMHFKEGGLTQRINPKLGYGTVRPSAQNNDQVRRACGNAHVLIKGFSESSPKYALT